VVHRAVVLLQWPYIQTVLQFPDRPAFRAGVDEVEIGFKSKLSPAPPASSAEPSKESEDG
jgi:hypothetical protein